MVIFSSFNKNNWMNEWITNDVEKKPLTKWWSEVKKSNRQKLKLLQNNRYETKCHSIYGHSYIHLSYNLKKKKKQWWHLSLSSSSRSVLFPAQTCELNRIASNFSPKPLFLSLLVSLIQPIKHFHRIHDSLQRSLFEVIVHLVVQAFLLLPASLHRIIMRDLFLV